MEATKHSQSKPPSDDFVAESHPDHNTPDHSTNIYSKQVPANNEDLVAELKSILTKLAALADGSSKECINRALVLTDKLASRLALCLICYQPFVDPKTTSCGHAFCTSCLETWLEENDTCPTCRCTVSPAAIIGTRTRSTAPLVHQSRPAPRHHRGDPATRFPVVPRPHIALAFERLSETRGTSGAMEMLERSLGGHGGRDR